MQAGTEMPTPEVLVADFNIMPNSSSAIFLCSGFKTFPVSNPEWRFFVPLLCKRDCIVGKSAYDLRHVHPSVCLCIRLVACISSATTRRISVNFDIGDFSEICQENTNLVKIGQKCLAPYMTTKVRFIVFDQIKSP
jgi:hypothetical protein